MAVPKESIWTWEMRAQAPGGRGYHLRNFVKKATQPKPTQIHSGSGESGRNDLKPPRAPRQSSELPPRAPPQQATCAAPTP